MIDANLPLRKAWLEILQPIAETYTDFEPDDQDEAEYFVIDRIGGNDNSPKSRFSREISVTLRVVTYGNKYSDGVRRDILAGQILELWGNQQTRLDLDNGLYMVKTQLVNDNTESWTQRGGRVYLNRILTFRHTITNNFNS